MMIKSNENIMIALSGERFKRQKMSQQTRVSTKLGAAWLLLLVALSGQLAAGSGVFELDLLRLDSFAAATTTTEPTSRENSNLVRVTVCLKEAYASQLDGPCTFGNASLTINSTDSVQQQEKLVRILFTFRWTKSFTIIITAEQIAQRIGAGKSQTANATTSAEQTTTRKSGEQAGDPQQQESPSGPINGQQRLLLVDRHVLTESEVLPSLELSHTKVWSNRFSRTPKSSLSYRFRVYCSANYFEDGCTTFCRPRNDQFGHHNCSSTGQKLCADGWEGPNCERAKCRPGCNQQHGYCDKPDTCQCRPGWTGLRCDECITYPGCHNGYCLAPWQCVCHQNWGGVLCDRDLNYCGSHEPCKNNGTCQNIAPDKYKCNCPPGFTGVDCELNLNLLPNLDTLTQISAGCALNPCQHGGTCFGFNDNLQIGEPTNDDSIVDLQSSRPATQSDDRYYRCQCAPGWTGDYCQWSEASISGMFDSDTATSADFMKATLANNSTVQSFIQENQEKVSIVEAPTNFRDQQSRSTNHVDMRHLISGVVIASSIGVFLASLLLAWCCLMAIKRNGLSFIQMNVIRNIEAGCQLDDEPGISSALRRMQEKIRDSFRRSASHMKIKPDNRLSVENVLRPPPAYDEIYRNHRNNLMATANSSLQQPISLDLAIDSESSSSDNNSLTKKSNLISDSLVIKGALKQKLDQNSGLTQSANPTILSNQRTNINPICPKHGHLYKQSAPSNNQIKSNNQLHQHHRNKQIEQSIVDNIVLSPEGTCITITKPPKTYPHQQTSHLS